MNVYFATNISSFDKSNGGLKLEHRCEETSGIVYYAKAVREDAKNKIPLSYKSSSFALRNKHVF